MADTLGGFNTQTTGFDRTIQELIIRNTIETLRQGLEFTPAGSIVKAVQKPGGSGTYRLTNWTDLPPDLTELGEVTPPGPTFMAGDDLEFSAKLIGQFVPVTWLSQVLAGEDLIARATEKVAYMAAQAYDLTAQTAYDAADGDVFGGDATQTSELDDGDTLTADLCMTLLTLARSNGLKPLPSGFYNLVGAPVAFDPLMRDFVSGKVPSANFGITGDLVKGEIGRFLGLSFRSTTKGTLLTGNSAAKCARLTLIGSQSLALSEVAGNFAAIVRRSVGTDDPIGQQLATIGYRAFVGAALVKVSNTSDGAGSADAQIQRSLTAEVSVVPAVVTP